VVQYSDDPLRIPPFPLHETIGLHFSRIKELNMVVELYRELGPTVTGEYCTVLSREIARNRYEKETVEEYKLMVSHLKACAGFCKELLVGEGTSAVEGRRRDKMTKLEQLLEQLLHDPEVEAIPDRVDTEDIDEAKEMIFTAEHRMPPAAPRSV